MTEELRLLWALQLEDDRLRELESALQRIPQELKALDQRLADDGRALDAQLQRIKQLQLERRGNEKEMAAQAEQEKRFQGQLFLVKTNQEYQALLHEIEGVRQTRSQIETRVLESMDEEEKLASGKATLEKAAADTRRLADARRAALEAERAKLEAEAQEVRSRRAALLDRLRPSTGPSAGAPWWPWCATLAAAACGSCRPSACRKRAARGCSWCATAAAAWCSGRPTRPEPRLAAVAGRR
jgi:predicted  nucleic acid-binding Zn-ribbon protein